MKLLISVSIFFLFLHCSSPLQFSGPEAPTDILALKNKSSDQDCTGGDCSHVETFHLQNLTAVVKALIVLDVSPSMNLNKMANSAMSILNALEPFDVQLAITTADHGDHEKRGGKVGEQKWQNYDGDRPYFGKFMRLEHNGTLLDDTILTKRIPNYKNVFYDTLALNPGQKGDCNGELPPYCQGGHEQPLRSAKAALEREENQDFFGGEENIVFILILTNEDERVEDPENATTGQEVKDTFESLYPDGNLYGFGVIVQDKSCYKDQKRANSRSEYSHRVAELAQVTLGRNISICNSEFSSALTGISRLMKERVFDNVQLKQHPKEVTQISVEPLQNVDWKVKGRHILFDPALQPESKITVHYTSS